MASKPTYSIVIPVFNGSQTLPELVSRLKAVFEKKHWSYEILLINDGSEDTSWQTITELARQPNVTGIDLLKNYGQHNANLCGFRHASGEYVITMDDDLQNSPEELPKLIDKAGNGNDLVLAKWKVKEHGWIRRLGSRAVNYINEKVFKKPAGLIMTNFRVIHRSIINRILEFQGINPYIPGLVIAFASNPVNVEIDHQPRRFGKSNYGVNALFRLVFALLFGYSTYPMRLLVFIGSFVALLSFSLTACLVLLWLFGHIHVPGWTSLAALISFFSGLIILLLGCLGEYIIRITWRVNASPNYFIREIKKHGA